MAAFKLSIADLAFVLKQIKVAEAHSEGRKLTALCELNHVQVAPHHD